VNNCRFTVIHVFSCAANSAVSETSCSDVTAPFCCRHIQRPYGTA